MKTNFYLNSKKTMRKAIENRIGAERLARMLEEAKETFFDDPLVHNDFLLETRC